MQVSPPTTTPARLKPAKPKPKTTIKQQRFIDLYDGDIKATSKEAKISYAYGRNIVAQFNLNKKLKERDKRRNQKKIKSRAERQAFWSDLMTNAEKDSDKLKASELLGRSEADFTDKIEKTHTISGSIMSLVADMVNKAKQLPAPEQTAEGIKKAITVKPSKPSKIIGLK